MKKFLGQHFLKNKSAVVKTLAALQIQKDDTVIEIGPGKGALTLPLLRDCNKVGAKLIAIEKDPELANSLISELVNWPDKEIICSDALAEIPKLINQLTNPLINYKLTGNIPYYITGHLLRALTESENPPKLVVLMIQREVAERISANPPKMNLLAAAVQARFEPKIIMRLKPTDFEPEPKVSSAIISLTLKNEVKVADLAEYYAALKLIFKQPRKTLLNNLSEGDLDKNQALKILESCGLDPKIRPQNLSIENIHFITKRLGSTPS